MLPSEPVIGVLNDLVETCLDGEHGFQACAQQARSEWLRAALARRAADCAAAAARWRSEVAALGGVPTDSGSMTAAVHRGWVALRTALATYDDLAVVSECERGEEAALDRYRRALHSQLPLALRERVSQEFEAVKRNRDQLRDLRDRLKEVAG